MPSARRQHGSGAPWEAIVGYSRAVRVGAHVHVAGTTASDGAGGVLHRGDPYGQTREVLARIEAALRALDARLEHVVRTRIYVTDIARWEPVGRAHGEVFGHVRPVATMVEVKRLIHPDMLVEIEAEAVVHDAADGHADGHPGTPGPSSPGGEPPAAPSTPPTPAHG